MQKLTIVFSVEMFNSPDGPTFAAYKTGYAIEMTFDTDWMFDMIALAPPRYLRQFADNDLQTYNVAFGASYIPSDRDFQRVMEVGGKWVLAFAADDLPVDLPGSLGIILYLNNIEEMDAWHRPKDLQTANLIIAIQMSCTDPSHANKTLISVREKWAMRFNDQVPRVIWSTGMSFGADEEIKELCDKLQQLPEADGILLLDINPVTVSKLIGTLHNQQLPR